MKQETTPHNRGGSLLSSSSPHIMQIMEGKKGAFQVKDMGNELDTAGLFYRPLPSEYNPEPGFSLVAMHPNGFSCHALATRIMKAWENGDVENAAAQAQYILDCGGMCIGLSSIRAIATAV